MPASAGTFSDFSIFIIECLPEWLRILCESMTLNEFLAFWTAWQTTSFLIWDFPVLSGKRYCCPVGQRHSSLKFSVPRTPHRPLRTTDFPFFFKARSVGRMVFRSTLLTWSANNKWCTNTYALTTWLLSFYLVCQKSLNTSLYISFLAQFPQLACGWRFKAAIVTVFAAQWKSEPLSFSTSVMRAHNAWLRVIATKSHVLLVFKMWFLHCVHIFPVSTAACPSFLPPRAPFFCPFFAMDVAWTTKRWEDGKSPFIIEAKELHAKQRIRS